MRPWGGGRGGRALARDGAGTGRRSLGGCYQRTHHSALRRRTLHRDVAEVSVDEETRDLEGGADLARARLRQCPHATLVEARLEQRLHGARRDSGDGG